MFGREQLECPGCKKVFRKKDMKTHCKTADGKYSEHYFEYSCVDCCTQKKHDDMYEDAEEELIVAWEHKASNYEKLSSLYQKRPTINRNHELISNQYDKAKQNVSDAISKSPEDTIGERPTSLVGVAIDFLDDSYKSRPGYQIAAAEEARLNVEDTKAGEAYYGNRMDIVKEIQKIEGKILCNNCLKLQPFRDPTTEDFERRRETLDHKYQNFEVFKTFFVYCHICDEEKVIEPNSFTQTKRDEIKEPARQSNDNSFCDNCGKSLRPTSKFCGGCGTPVS